MRLDHATWYEVEDYLKDKRGIILPTGSHEQHGPIGLIGTDAICAGEIAARAARIAGVYVAPTLAYTPAPFNTGFPGTVSLSESVFRAMAGEFCTGLHDQGFTRIYVLNGHGANLKPLGQAAQVCPEGAVRIKSWWDFDAVNRLRADYYGDWEGMHATPSEVAITQAVVRRVDHPDAQHPPKALSAAFIKAHAGDKHGPPDQHRADFPDGRVGSHSTLARPEHGQALLEAAAQAISADVQAYVD